MRLDGNRMLIFRQEALGTLRRLLRDQLGDLLSRAILASTKSARGAPLRAAVDARLVDAILPLRARLEGLGLLVMRREKWIARWLPFYIGLIPAAIGAIRFLYQFDEQGFRGDYDTLKILAYWGYAVAANSFGRSLHRSRRGDKAFARLKTRYAVLEFRAGHRIGELSSEDVIRAVGLFGHGVLLGGPLAALHPALPAVETREARNQ